MVSRIVGALALVVLLDGLAAAQSSESPLVVKVTTERRVYRSGRAVHIMLTETNTSNQPVEIVTGCQILHARVTAPDGAVAWEFYDWRLCATVLGKLAAGATRTLELTWHGGVSLGGDFLAPIPAPPGRYRITAGVDGVEDSTVVRLRRRRK
jgi:hypothetical protein